MEVIVIIQAIAGHFFFVGHGLDSENRKLQTP